MTLYEINGEIARLQERVEWNDDANGFIDLDTGEILSEEELNKLFDDLQMDKRERLEWMAKAVINDRGQANSIDAEIKRLQAMKKRFERRAERFEEIIVRECNGEKTQLGVATVSFRKSTAVEYDPEKIVSIAQWLEECGYSRCVRKKDPELDKNAIKSLSKTGVYIPNVNIVERVNGSLK